jgi:hypothetical protein
MCSTDGAGTGAWYNARYSSSYHTVKIILQAAPSGAKHAHLCSHDQAMVMTTHSKQRTGAAQPAAATLHNAHSESQQVPTA